MEKNTPLLAKPAYYDKFTCIADKCTITCCQEWKISIDTETNLSWKRLLPPDGMAKSRKNLSSYTEKKDGQRIIRLDENHRCPFLSDKRLCRLVTAYGDSVLSNTCTTFPREFHDFKTHREAMLMPCCPAVIDLWKDEPIVFPELFCNSSEYTDNVFDNKLSIDVSSPAASSQDTTTYINMFRIRNNIIRLLQNQAVSIEEALLESFYILLELYRQPAVTEALVDEYFSAASLQALKNAIDDVDLPVSDTISECNELLQDLAVNYMAEGLYSDFLTPLMDKAELMSGMPHDKLVNLEYCYTSVINSLSTSNRINTCDTLNTGIASQSSNVVNSYTTLFGNFLANEIFSDLFMPDDNLEDMLIHMEWIAIEYAAIRHSLFLSRLDMNSYSQNLSVESDIKSGAALNAAHVNKIIPDYETIRQHIVILSRMTGYENDDIYEYLENSFEAPIWDWGYFALIVGKANG